VPSNINNGGAPADAPGSSSRLVSGRSRRGEHVIQYLLGAAAMVSVGTTLLIVLSLARETIAFLGEVPIGDFLFGTEWAPLFADASFGVLPLIAGTAVTTVIAISVAIPLGLGAAIYLSEYATPRARGILKPVLELLAGVPTVVFGYFALTFITPIIFNDILGLNAPVFNALSAGVIMGFMVMPTIASLAEDAMSAVPRSLREGAYGLGANRMQVSVRVVFPAALSGIVAGVVLGISRAVGETMIVVVAAGQQPILSANPLQSFQTLTSYIAAVAKGDAAVGSIAYQTLFAVGMLLFLLTLLMNTISIRFVRKFRQVY
jgi:phosphate transport system permease protein